MLGRRDFDFPIPNSLREIPCQDEVKGIVEASLLAVEPGRVIKTRVSLSQNVFRVCDKECDLAAVGRVEILGVGKAVQPMVSALYEILGSRIDGGLAIGKKGGIDPAADTGPVDVVEAAHPVPDTTSVAAAKELVRRADLLGVSDLALVLIGGGASSLLTYPALGLELAHVQETTDLLLRSGATIQELNAVRKHISRVKGGRLAKRIAPARTVGLVLSDVVGDALDAIGSGPTAPDPTTFEDAWRVLRKAHILGKVPKEVRDYLKRGRRGEIPDTPKSDDPVFRKVDNFILGSNRHAGLGAVEMARRMGFEAHLLTSSLEGEARVVGGLVTDWINDIRERSHPIKSPACLVLGGETTVTVKGNGMGGRNQELALAAAIAVRDISDVLIVALATDGGDGPTDAAGAVASGTSFHRAKAMGMDPKHYLDNNDAYEFFDRLGDLIRTGPTMTNVADLLFIFVF